MGVVSFRRISQASAIALGAAIVLAPWPARSPAPSAALPPEVARPSGALASRILERQASLSVNDANRLAQVIEQESSAASLDPVLVLAVIEIESGWSPGAVSERGARGLMQLRKVALESEERRAGLDAGDAHDPVHNVRMGIRYLARMVAEFQDVDLGLMAYNVGPTRFLEHLLAVEDLPDPVTAYARKVRREERKIRREMLRAGVILAAAAR